MLVKRVFIFFLVFCFVYTGVYVQHARAIAPAVIWASARVAGKWMLKNIFPLFTPVTNTAIRVGVISSEEAIRVAAIMELESLALGAGFLMVTDKDDAGVVGANAKKSPLVVHLNDKSPQRSNPDEEKWNDAPAGEVDPVLKPLVSSDSYEVREAPVAYGKPELDLTSIVKTTASVTVIGGSGGGTTTNYYEYKTRFYSIPKDMVDEPYIAPANFFDFVSRKKDDNVMGAVVNSDILYSGIVSEYSADKKYRYDWIIAVNYFTGWSVMPPAVDSNGDPIVTYVNVNRPIVYNSDTGVISGFGSWSGTHRDSFVPSRIASNYPLGYRVVNTEAIPRDIWGGSSSHLLVVHFQRKVKMCNDGYSYDLSDHVCAPDENLEKPATTPCEIVFKDGKWQSDKLNPNCKAFVDRYAISGPVVRVKAGDGEAEVIRNADGTFSIKHHSIDDGEWRTVESGKFNEAEGLPVNSVTKSPTGGFSSVVSYGNGASGQGSGCGGADNPCKIDDSGFAGKEGDINGLLSDMGGKVDGESKKLSDDLAGKQGNSFGFVDSFDWLPRIFPENLECRDLFVNFDFNKLNFLDSSAEIKFCDYVGGIREFMYWVFYVVTVLVIWRRFVNAPVSGERMP